MFHLLAVTLLVVLPVITGTRAGNALFSIQFKYGSGSGSSSI